MEIDFKYNSDQVQVIVVPMLLSSNGENISRDYRPMVVRQGVNQVLVLFNHPGCALSAELFIYIFEYGTPGDAFFCRRFSFIEDCGCLRWIYFIYKKTEPTNYNY